MLIKNKKATDPLGSEITPESTFLNRRKFLLGAGIGAASVGLGLAGCDEQEAVAAKGEITGTPLPNVVKSQKYQLMEQPTDFDKVATYNNFYEFGTDKSYPAKLAKDFVTKPWTVEVDGHCAKPGTYGYDDLVSPHQLEERVYRFRCVEAWSMIVPWVGVSLGEMIKKFEPTSNAKYVKFETLHDETRMPGQTMNTVPWPYVEGLRMDEALHPLAFMTVGYYGVELLPQNGAPLRMILPWKYGFKSIKSIVRISFVEKEPVNTWQVVLPNEYGFYANVNPEVDHPRWSQAKERRLGDGVFTRKRPTLMFNGYADEVASLYTGMDLSKFY